MPKKFIRKDKIELELINDEQKKITVSLLIDSNHPNSQLDNLLELLSSNVKSTLMNYKETVKEDKKDKPKSKSKSKSNFGDGVYV